MPGIFVAGACMKALQAEAATPAADVERAREMVGVLLSRSVHPQVQEAMATAVREEQAAARAIEDAMFARQELRDESFESFRSTSEALSSTPPFSRQPQRST